MARASLGTKIRRARTAAGLSLRDVSAATNGQLSASGLSLVEQDKRNPSLHTLEVLAQALPVRFTISPNGTVVETKR